MKHFQFGLVESELKIILAALTAMEQKMAKICDVSDDEDETADIGNDLTELRLLLKLLQEQAINQYGANIMNFSRQPL